MCKPDYDFPSASSEIAEGLIIPGYEEGEADIRVMRRDIVDTEDEFNEPGSFVKYPLTQLFDLARTLQIVNDMPREPYASGYRIFSVIFEENSPTNPFYRGGEGRSNHIMGFKGYNVQMHTQTKRFEDYVDRFGATITALSVLNLGATPEDGHRLHVTAVCQIDHLCWLEVVCIYSEADFPASVSLEDGLKGAFIEHARNRGWPVLKSCLN